MKTYLSILVATVFTPMILAAGEISFNEDFALAEDRSVPLSQLIPGTDDYFYYHCLDSQLRGDFRGVDEFLAKWKKQHHDTSLMREIQTRQYLLQYGSNPERALKWIRDRLGLRFNHEKRVPDKVPNYPTSLDPGRISWAALRRNRLARHDGLQYFEELAYERLIREKMDADRRRRLLGLLKRADYPRIPELVVADLKHKNSGGFGCHKVHGAMTLDQLDQCLAQLPELIKNTRFIDTYLAKIRASEDADPESRENRALHLERLWAFVSELPAARNSLKACILYRQLEFDREDNEYNLERFMEYIKLPRNMHYVRRDYLQRDEFERARADLGENFQAQTLLPPIGTDEELVRDYLAHFLLEATDHKAFAEYIDEQYLKELFAETKIVNGIGDMQRWYNLLPAAKYQRLKERIDLEFLPTNDRFVARNERVQLSVAIKNIEKLIVNIYELNTANYYRDQTREITTAVDLDGLVPNHERVVEYDLPPLRRHVEELNFPEIRDSGVYVVELIGNGRSSRALIRRGTMNFFQRRGSAGHVFRVYDESGNFLPKASIWMAGTEYSPDERGEINIPFSNKPGTQQLILQDGEFAVLRQFRHESENYALNVGFQLPREALVADETARVLVRPLFTLNGVEIDPSLLLEPKLAIRSTDGNGIRSATETREIELKADGEWTYEIKVPEDLRNLQLVFSGKVESLSEGRKIDLQDSYRVGVSQIKAGDKTSDLFLRRTDRGYAIDFLGRTGEPIADRAVHLAVKHRMITDDEEVMLKTNARGRVELGTLSEVTSVRAWTDDGLSQQWFLHRDNHSYAPVIQAEAGSPVAVPFMGMPEADVFSPFSLVEHRGGQVVKDWSQHVVEEAGYLVARDLPAGDYSMLLKGVGAELLIRLADTIGDRESDGVLVGKARLMELTNPIPLQIAGTEVTDNRLVVSLTGAGPETRLHVVSTRFQPDHSAFNTAPYADPGVWALRLAPTTSTYLSGRNIGDEYRYVLERKYATKFPGNMLTRPSLLLVPWALRDTQTGTDKAGQGDGWAGDDLGESHTLAKRAGGRHAGLAGSESPGGFTCFDFLPSPAVVLSNLKPDPQGAVSVDLEAVGPGSILQLVAIENRDVAYRTILLSEKEETYRDLRLRRALPEGQHLAERKKVTPLRADTEFTIEDMTTSRMELYDSLAAVFGLYSTLSSNSTLAEFAFVLMWPELNEEEKLEKYSKYACHELNFFLYRKDANFFKDVIRPFIAAKKDKTFMDFFLLEADLTPFLEPYAYNRLNAVEKILLAERLPGRQASTARLIKEAYDLIPPDVEVFNYLFDTAVKGNALEESELAAAFLDANGEAPVELEEVTRSFAAAGEAEATAAPRTGWSMATRKKSEPKPAAALPPGRPEREANKLEVLVLAEAERSGTVREDRRRDAAKREKLRQLYRKLEKTKEWVETNYYHLPIESQLADLIKVNAFWRDYAARETGQPFLSPNLAEANGNFTEMMLALAVLDLPFKPGKSNLAVAERQLRIRPEGPAIAFHREIMPAEISDTALPFLVSQNFFDPANRYRYEDNEKIDRFVREEFIRGKVYGCQIVLTNPTGSRRKINVLQQVPLGAIPVANAGYTKGHSRQLEPYSTQAMEYRFYFPVSGQFRHYPVHVAQNEVLVGQAEAFTFNVVDKPTIIDTESWEYISQNGSLDEVLTYLQEHNIQRLNLGLIAFRMRDREAFEEVLSLLAENLLYEDVLWSYSVHHNVPARILEYLPHTALADQCGRIFASELLNIEPIPRHVYQHKEYWPLVNARVYQLGKRRKILNSQFHGQYEQFMKVLTYRKQLTSADRMGVIVYLLLQDRVAEALEQYAKVDPDQLGTRMQYDYLAAYMNFYRGRPKEAARIAKRYADYPVERWRNLFAVVVAQTEEIQGGKGEIVDPEDRDQVQSQLAESAPSLELTRDGDKFLVDYRNVDTAKVSYYPMDVELLFSRNPFVQDISSGFSIIRPHLTEMLKLNPKREQAELEIPKQFADRNVMIEVSGRGVTRRQAYYPNALLVQMMPTYGQLRVTEQDNGKPLPQVYVKVYARLKDGSVEFYKDGYTDLRGRFDYTSLSTDMDTQVQRYSILVLSEELGAVVREAAPPKM